MDGRNAVTTSLVRAALAVALVAAGAGSAASFATAAPPAPVPIAVPAKAVKAPPSGDAVVGLVDTGINPYHVQFRDTSKRAQQYPGTYLAHYPKGATALRLSLGEKDYWQAVRKDCARVWSKVVPGRLYWFPGTRIVGGISFHPAGTVDCSVPKPTGIPILDSEGHGTMTASRAAATTYGACKTCLVVAAQHVSSVNLASPGGSTEPAVNGIRWLAKNASWIDAQSNSWGPIAPGYDPTGQAGLLVTSPGLARAAEEVSRTHLAFWASGNGAAFRFGIVGHPTLAAPHLGPSAIIVGGHDSGLVATWPGFSPNAVSDGCASWAARSGTMNGSGDSVGSGTSAATPFVAGGAAQILKDARGILGDKATGVRAGGVVAKGRAGVVKAGPLADGTFTLDEWRAVTFKTASRRPVKQYEDGPPCTPAGGLYGPTPVQWSQVPDAFPEAPLIGYGAIDRQSIALAGRVLRGAPMPDRASTDQFFAVDRQVRQATYTAYTTAP